MQRTMFIRMYVLDAPALCQNIVKILSPQARPIILVFCDLIFFYEIMTWSHPTGSPPTGPEIQVECENCTLFSQLDAVSQIRCEVEHSHSYN